MEVESKALSEAVKQKLINFSKKYGKSFFFFLLLFTLYFFNPQIDR